MAASEKVGLERSERNETASFHEVQNKVNLIHACTNYRIAGNFRRINISFQKFLGRI